MPVPRPSSTSDPRPPDAERRDPLAGYRALERHCARMLEAARRDDWPGLERLGRESHAMIAATREHANETLDAPQRTEKFRLLRSIVRIDAQIRRLHEPWTRTIDRMLSAPPRREDETGPGSAG